MFAVVRTGGKQYRVSTNTRLAVERLPGAPGDVLRLDDVLLIGGDGTPIVGAPRIDGAAVFARVVEHKRGDKVLIFKKKRRKNHRRLNGHRQELTVLSIVGISPTGEAPTDTTIHIETAPATAASVATPDPAGADTAAAASDKQE